MPKPKKYSIKIDSVAGLPPQGWIIIDRSSSPLYYERVTLLQPAPKPKYITRFKARVRNFGKHLEAMIFRNQQPDT